jgi:hypothetical protein
LGDSFAVDREERIGGVGEGGGGGDDDDYAGECRGSTDLSSAMERERVCVGWGGGGARV